MGVVRVRGLWPFSSGDLAQQVTRYCVMILTILALSHVVLMFVYFKEPVNCWCPAQFTQLMCRYVSMHCITAKDNPLVLPFPIADEIPTKYVSQEEIKTYNMPVYYLYTPLILLLLASVFYIPLVLRRELLQFGTIPDELIQSAKDSWNLPTKQGLAIKDLASHIHLICKQHLYRRHVAAGFRCFHGSTLTIMYITTSIIIAMNSIGMFFILDVVLDMPFHNFGWHMIGRLPAFHPYFNPNITMDATDVRAPYDFQQSALCDVTIRPLGNIHRYTIQCDFPLNSLNELIFKYLWFLIFVVATVTSTCLISSIFYFLAFPCWRMGIRETLQDHQVLNRDDKHVIASVDAFEREYLHRDGSFLLDCVKKGGGSLIMDQVIMQLWQMYMEEMADLSHLLVATEWQETVVDSGDIVSTTAVKDPNEVVEMQAAEEMADQQKVTQEYDDVKV